MRTVGENMGEDPVDYIWFNETSKRGATMGKFRGLAVFAENGYHESILPNHTYLCTLSKKGNVYNAIPLQELTAESIAEEKGELMESMCEHLYRIAPEKFDSFITAAQIRNIREEEREKVSKDVEFLRKENNRLKEEMATMVHPVEVPVGDIPDGFEGIRGGRYYSQRLDGYYSIRVSYRKSEALLVEDDDGQINGCGGMIDLAEIHKLLGKDIRGEYCDLYGGVLFTKNKP